MTKGSESSKSAQSKIAVVGAGQMGGGIAQVFATAGYHTLLFDESPAALQSCIARIEKLLSRMLEKGKISEIEKKAISSRLHPIDALNKVNQADVIIEAILEDIAAKQELFAELDSSCKETAILATNTSSISITEIAAATTRPERVVGMHFMNPVPVMELVEVIRGLQTSDETYQQVLELTTKLGKSPVSVKHDYPGFIVNRILVPMLNEAFFVLMEGSASPKEIDKAMKLGTNQPMGPLELADFVGLDIVLAISKILHAQLGEDKYRPCPLLVKYVEAGWLGRKSGRGVYTY